jgi:hypothetical protein
MDVYCTIGCIDFNNSVMLTQKRMLNLILRQVYKKSFFEPFRPGLSSEFQKTARSAIRTLKIK